MDHCLRAETLLPEREHIEARANIYAVLGAVHYSRGRMDLATCAVDRGFWLLRDVPDEDMHATLTDLLTTRATIQRNTGERARAGITLSRARQLASGEMVSSVEQCTASWLLSDGEAERALEHALRAIELAELHGNRVILPFAHLTAGASLLSLERRDEASDHISSGLRIAGEDSDHRAYCRLIRQRAELERQRGNFTEALSLLNKAKTVARQKGFLMQLKNVALELAEIYEVLEDYKSAVEQHKLAWELQDQTRTC